MKSHQIKTDGTLYACAGPQERADPSTWTCVRVLGVHQPAPGTQVAAGAEPEDKFLLIQGVATMFHEPSTNIPTVTRTRWAASEDRGDMTLGLALPGEIVATWAERDARVAAHRQQMERQQTDRANRLLRDLAARTDARRFDARA